MNEAHELYRTVPALPDRGHGYDGESDFQVLAHHLRLSQEELLWLLDSLRAAPR